MATSNAENLKISRTITNTTTSRRKERLCRNKSFSLDSINGINLYRNFQPNLSMEGLTLYSSLSSSDGEQSPDEHHMKQFPDLCRHCGRMRSDDQIPLLRNSSPSLVRSPSDEQASELGALRREAEELRRENNRMVLQTAYLRKENSAQVKRLKEERVIRESLTSQLDQLQQKMDTATTSVFEDHSINSSTQSFSTEVINEQLRAYREDFYEEKREREKFHARNIELERQLEEAKKTLEMQQKKLLLYSQIFSQPLRTKLDLPISMTTKDNYEKTNSTTPSTQPYSNSCDKNERKRTAIIVDLPRDYKSNEHILEATLLSGERPRIKRSTTPPAYSSQDYYPGKLYEYQWSLNSEDIIPK